MKISIVTPAARHARSGNRNTAARWARFLRELGHRVVIERQWSGSPADLMIALHARRSHTSIAGYAERYPDRPLIVVLTGTDLYRDIRTDADAQRSLALATRLVVLQEMGPKALRAALRAKTRVIYQSAPRIARPEALASCFEVVVSGHLRAEKDPFRAAAALAHLPRRSRIRVTHVGGALTPEMAAQAREWMSREPRYRWLGEVQHGRALRMLARSRVMVISSRMEGGANVVSEALTLRVPVVASRVAGNVGMLGSSYAGYYPVGDERSLAGVLARVERDCDYYRLLQRSCAARAALITPGRERRALARLIAEVTAPANSKRNRVDVRQPAPQAR